MKAEVERLRNEMALVAKDVILDSIRPIFEKYPELQSVSWTQYTPYFNDGDACTFGIGLVTANFEPEQEEEWKDWCDVSRQVESLLEEIGEDTLNLVFGDGFEIKIGRDGSYEKDTYEHG